MTDLRYLLAIYVHAHQTGNSVPPHIDAEARAALAEAYEAEANNPPEGHPDPEPFQAILRERAAALAQPEQQEPTDEELLRTYGGAKRDHCYDGPIDDWPKRAERAATVHGLRAVLARWGRPAINPVPVVERLPGAQGPTDEELDAIWFAARWGRPAVEPTDG